MNELASRTKSIRPDILRKVWLQRTAKRSAGPSNQHPNKLPLTANRAQTKRTTHTQPEEKTEYLSEDEKAVRALIEQYLQELDSSNTGNVREVVTDNLLKETLTHNGSCGAYGLSVAFCLAILEENHEASDVDFSKLVTTWNTTYPNNRKESIGEIAIFLKSHLADANTEDMEDIIGPLIRVYIGIAELNNALLRGNKLVEPGSGSLCEDINAAWEKSKLTKDRLDNVRDRVVTDATNPLETSTTSYSYYLDDNELNTVAHELLGLKIKRAVEISTLEQSYKDVNDKIKVNDIILKRHMESNPSQSIDICSANRANPGRIDGIGEGFHRIDMQDDKYIKWQQFKGVAFKILKAKLNQSDELTLEDDSSGLEALYRHVAGQANFSAQFDFQKNRVKWEDFCDEKAVEFTEKLMWECIRNGRKRFWYDKNPQQELTRIVHSGEVYWDFLMTQEHFNKYSRTKTSKKYQQCSTQPYKNLNNPTREESITLLKTLESTLKNARVLMGSVNLTGPMTQLWGKSQKLITQYRNPIATMIATAALTSLFGFATAMALLMLCYVISTCIKSQNMRSLTIPSIKLPHLTSNLFGASKASWRLTPKGYESHVNRPANTPLAKI